RAGLERQVYVFAQARQFGVGGDHVFAHVLRVRARVADAVDAVDLVDLPQQVAEADAGLLRQVAAVRVDVLPEQRDLPHPVRPQYRDPVDELVRIAAHLPPARGRIAAA